MNLPSPDSPRQPVSPCADEDPRGSDTHPATEPQGGTSYADQIMREVMPQEPFLIENEEIVLKASHGYSPSGVIVAVLVTIIPTFWMMGSFVWGPLLLVIMWYHKKRGGLWITNLRFVDFKPRLFGGFRVTSIPLSEIRRVRYAKGGDVVALLDRLFGIGDLQVSVRDSKWVQCQILAVKSPKALIRYVQQVTKDHE